jgi:carbonic anhydrase/acetyltransferase-like protein (isoleucine patch superfamily)
MRTIDQIREDRKPVVLLGSAISMHNVTESIEFLGREIVGIWDLDYQGHSHLHDYPILPADWLDTCDRDEFEFLVATNWGPGPHAVVRRNRSKRRDLITIMQQRGLVGATIVHPSANVSPRALLGRNVCVGAFGMITTRAKLYDNVSMKEYAYVSHDAVIGSDTVLQLKSTVTGHVELGERCYVGINASVIHRGEYSTEPMVIGNDVLIHPGVRVMQALPDGAVASLGRANKFSRVY